MNVNKWGNHGWEFLHTIAFNYPEQPTKEQKTHYKNFFTNITYVLPCKYCRESFILYLKYIPIDIFLDNKYSLSYWLFSIHNLINQKINKPNFIFKDICKKYNSYKAKCSKNSCNIDVVNSSDYNTIFCNKTYKYKCIIENLIKKLKKIKKNPNKNNFNNDIKIIINY